MGQKAVFHVCDAFIVVPFGYGAFESFVVNPFHGLEEAGEFTAAWEVRTGVADQLRQYLGRTNLAGPHLALWLPLRRKEIVPPPGQFDAWTFGGDGLLDELTDAPVLATVLSAARHLKQLQILDHGESRLSLARDGGHMKGAFGSTIAGSPPDESRFGGTIRIRRRERDASLAFRACEARSSDSDFQLLRANHDWPRTWTLDGKAIAEKAEPHGAAFLVRHDGPQSRLAIYWGVFLPTGDKPRTVIAIEAPSDGPAIDLHLFLHGYFFVDAGRRYIEGFEDSGSSDSTYADICGKWNHMVRDRVTLPMLPGLFFDALDHGALPSRDLARVVRALASAPWFMEHRAAIASREQLAELWDGQTLAWRTLPTPNERIGRVLCGKLRDAMFAEGQFADGDAIRGILSHVRENMLVPLPDSAVSTEVLQALAATGCEPLAVKGAWLDEAHRALIADDTVLTDMLRALEALTRGPQVDRAAVPPWS